jgi:hypothetical protein
MHTIQEEVLSDNPELFTALRSFKTTLGDLINNFESTTPGKVAMQRVYAVIANGIDAAAKAADPAIEAAFNEANNVYTKIIPIIDGLEGKATANFFNDPFAAMVSAVGALTSLGLGHGALALPAAAASFAGSKMLETYGPQAIAAGLNAAAPLVAPAIQTAFPTAANIITSALKE